MTISLPELFMYYNFLITVDWVGYYKICFSYDFF